MVLAQIGPGALICGLPDLKSLLGRPLLFIMSLLGRALFQSKFNQNCFIREILHISVFFGRAYAVHPPLDLLVSMFHDLIPHPTHNWAWAEKDKGVSDRLDSCKKMGPAHI